MNAPVRPGLPRIAGYALPQMSELPTARAPWVLQPERAALLVHDMQGYFVSAFTPGVEPISVVVANIGRLLNAARAARIPVFYTAQNGNQLPADRGIQADLWGPGMSAAPGPQAIVEPLRPAPGDTVLVKHRYSAFQRSELASLLREQRRDQLLITGVYAHIGVLCTAAEAFQRDLQVFLAADALADFSREKHDQALAWVAACCGVPLPTTVILDRLPLP